jgi:lysophospholipase L1-like esterase
MKTQTMNGDWRDQHIIDGIRVPDPVLLWRSRAGTFPINSQGFKTTIEMETPKPRDVFRVMAYGDSNTEGTSNLDWSHELHRLLQPRNTPERTYEVVNAGVSGYTSYQGVQRFLQEWKKYEPDLILVSFGWNDISKGMGQPDKTYRAKSPVMVQIIRALLQYRFYLVIQHYTVSSRIPENRKKAPTRVSLDDYLDNMTRFGEVGREQDIEVVFLTRPHRYTTAKMLEGHNWRSRVPRYNKALFEFSEKRGEHLIDVQKYFETETEGLFMDETHFSEQGMTEMAHFLIRELDLRGLLETKRGNAAGA